MDSPDTVTGFSSTSTSALAKTPEVVVATTSVTKAPVGCPNKLAVLVPISVAPMSPSYTLSAAVIPSTVSSLGVILPSAVGWVR